jgi:DNA-binding Lrp family transcriptional regulator
MAASTQIEYRNSDAAQSAKKREFLSRDEIGELLDTADFSRDTEAVIVRKGVREKGRRNYRRRHLVAALKGIWRASTRPYSSGGEILCFASVEGYAIEAGVSERALRYNLRELEKIGVLQMVHPANSIRRPATYRLNLTALRRRRTYDEIKKSRPPRRALHSIHHSSPPAQEAAKTTTAAPVVVPAPVTVAPDPSQFTGSRPQDRVRKLRQALAVKMIQQIKAGSTKENALTMAAMSCGLTYDEAEEQLKVMKFNPSVLLEGNIDEQNIGGANHSASQQRSERGKRNILDGIARAISSRDAPDGGQREDGS